MSYGTEAYGTGTYGGSDSDTPPPAAAGTRCLKMVGTPIDDDVAQSTEPWPVEPGQTHRTSALTARPTGTGPGRLRLRTVYGGQFRHADVLGGDGDFEDVSRWTDISPTPSDAEVVRYSVHPTHGLGAARLGPTTRPQVLTYGGFEDGLTGWHFDEPTEGHWAADPSIAFEGSGSVVTDTSVALAVKTLHHTDKWPVVPGEKWRVEARLRAEDGTDGAEHLLAVIDHELLPELGTWHHGTDVRGTSAATEGWQYASLDVEIDDGYVGFGTHIQVRDHTTGFWSVDRVTLTRIEGNTCGLVGLPHPIVPRRKYDLRFRVESDVAVTNGSVSVLLRLSGPGRTDRVVESSTTGPTGGESHEVQLSLDVPSGYDTVVAEPRGRDIEGGSFWLDELTIVDADASTYVVDVVRVGTGLVWAPLAQETTAPDGAETIRVEAIAEEGGDGWEVTDFSIERTQARRWTVAEVLADLLNHPETGNPLLTPGDIVDLDYLIAYDWRITNLTSRAAVRQLARAGVSKPPFEWRVNPDLTVDAGPTVGTDRTDIVLGPGSVVVLDQPEVTTDITDIATRVRVIGAERVDAPGGPNVVTGQAEVPDGPRDWFGRPLQRTVVITDTSIDHGPYASSLAAYELDRIRTPKQNVRLSLADWRPLGTIREGDWIYVYAPTAGLVDPTNEREVGGRLVYPKQVRVVSMSQLRGSGRIELRAHDGTITDITRWVRFEGETSGVIEVGDLLPDNLAPDPQTASPR